jgi:hypothetical protein
MWCKDWDGSSVIVFGGHPSVDFLQQCLVNSCNEASTVRGETQTWTEFGRSMRKSFR